MTPHQLEKAARRLYGDASAWQSRLADDLDVAPSTVWRWMNGRSEITRVIALAVSALEKQL